MEQNEVSFTASSPLFSTGSRYPRPPTLDAGPIVIVTLRQVGSTFNRSPACERGTEGAGKGWKTGDRTSLEDVKNPGVIHHPHLWTLDQPM